MLIAGPMTGGAVNPVRALGPMLITGQFAAAWIYILGPIAGGIVGALMYDRFLAEGSVPD